MWIICPCFRDGLSDLAGQAGQLHVVLGAAVGGHDRFSGIVPDIGAARHRNASVTAGYPDGGDVVPRHFHGQQGTDIPEMKNVRVFHRLCIYLCDGKGCLGGEGVDNSGLDSSALIVPLVATRVACCW